MIKNSILLSICLGLQKFDVFDYLQFVIDSNKG